MAQIHRTTLTPGKLDLVGPWLTKQPWFVRAPSTGRAPDHGTPVLSRGGGFRLDDPGGAVGIEFMVIADESAVDPADESAGQPVFYLVPVTYRGAPLAGAEHALIGTTEHGVLGRRWVYDGVHDLVLVSQLLALVQNLVRAQAQNVSDTVDEKVIARAGLPGRLDALRATATDAGDGTVLAVDADEPSASRTRQISLRIARLLRPNDDLTDPDPDIGYISGVWHTHGGVEPRGRFVTLDASE